MPMKEWIMVKPPKRGMMIKKGKLWGTKIKMCWDN
jgi:hypothetical protein